TTVPPRVERPGGDLGGPKAPASEPVRPARSDSLAMELLASSGDGVVAYDRNLRHTLWNPRMEELTGLSPDGVLGREVLQLFPAARQREITTLLERALAGETVSSDDFAWPSGADGGERWMSAVFAPHRDASGGVRGVVGIVRDVTARRLIAEASAPVAL